MQGAIIRICFVRPWSANALECEQRGSGPPYWSAAREAERRVGNFNPQERANTAWAFATLGQPDSQLFSALAREAESKRWPPSWSANKKATQSKS